MKPSLASASHAADLVACATFRVLTPDFRPTQSRWLPNAVDLLVAALTELEAERDGLAMLAQIDPAAA